MNAPAEVAVPGIEVRDIPGFEGLYAASADGRIWAHEKTRIVGQGRTRVYRPKWLLPSISDGYEQVKLMRYGEDCTCKVHRLVALAWIGRPPTALHQVNHIDGRKTNNRPSNLEWATRSENLLHAYRLGLARITDKQRLKCAETIKKAQAARRKLSQQEADLIRGLVVGGMRKSHAARMFGVTYWTVRDIVSNKTYTRDARETER